MSDLSEAGGRAMLLESFGWRREERGRLFFVGTAAGFAPVGVVVEAIVAITALQTRRSPHLAQKFKFCNLQRRSGAFVATHTCCELYQPDTALSSFLRTNLGPTAPKFPRFRAVAPSVRPSAAAAARSSRAQ